MELLSSLEQLSVGEIVTNDFRTAEIFKKAGIDFCCGGKKSLTQACSEKNLTVSTLVSEISNLTKEENKTYNYNEWDLGFLCDYITNTHHKYVLRTLPNLVFYTSKIAEVHGANHPELKKVAVLFQQINGELLQHLKKEEEVLFPAIKETIEEQSENNKFNIQSEINRMLGEHDFAGGAMDDINVLTKNYTLPTDACNTYKVTFDLLRQFEDDLHVHVHLENNILYPKALKL